MRISKDEQGGDVKEAAKGFDDASSKTKNQCKQGKAPADWLEQNIHECRHGNLRGHFNEIERKTQSKQILVSQNVGCRHRGVINHDDTATDEQLGNDSRGNDDQI